MTAKIVGLDRFNAQLKNFARKTLPRKFNAVRRVIVLEGFRHGVRTTPVDTGRLRGGWTISQGGPPSGPVAPGVTRDPIGRGVAALKGVKPYSSIWITNAVGYAPVVDQGGFVPANPGPSKDPRKGRKGRVLVQGGYSVQAPRGMTEGMVRVMQRSVLRAIAASRSVT